MPSPQSTALFSALNAAQTFDFSQQSGELRAYVAQTTERLKDLDRKAALAPKTAAMIAESLADWHSDRTAGAPRRDGPNQGTYQSIVFSGGDSLRFNRFVLDYFITPAMFDQDLRDAIQDELAPLGITLKSLNAAPCYANDGPPEFKRMDRPATNTYCHIVAEIDI